MNLDNVDVSYLEDGNVYRPVLKKNPNFFLKKSFLVLMNVEYFQYTSLSSVN